eukprot:1755039-Rhodomonas_salina.1
MLRQHRLCRSRTSPSKLGWSSGVWRASFLKAWFRLTRRSIAAASKSICTASKSICTASKSICCAEATSKPTPPQPAPLPHITFGSSSAASNTLGPARSQP